jgi:hypothetical protein
LNNPVFDLKSGIPADVLIPAPTINNIFENLLFLKDVINFLYFISKK